MKNKKIYILLSWTWGLPMNLIGHIVALILMCAGYRSAKWGGCRYFVFGENWGGLSLGSIVIVDRNYNSYILNHEFGHSIQNCYFGFLFPFIVMIPSAVRYWYQRIVVNLGLKQESELPDYYSIWFEEQASRLGSANIGYWEHI